jgi:hypothetical protein
MPSDLEIQIIRYYPPGVTTIVASSFSCFLGRIDENTVLKYPHDESPDINEQTRLTIEAQIYTPTSQPPTTDHQSVMSIDKTITSRAGENVAGSARALR